MVVALEYVNESSVRGRLEGYLRAFDKHYNLFLTDVDEEYSSNNFNVNIFQSKVANIKQKVSRKSDMSPPVCDIRRR